MSSSCESTDSDDVYDGYDSDALSSCSISDDFNDLDKTFINHLNFYRPGPFDLRGRTFEELPEAMRRFLVDMELYPKDFADLNEFLQALLIVCCKRQNRLERTLDGVNRAIVREMLDSHTRTGDGTMDARCIRVVGEVLQPEWKEHLDQYVEEIDALIWLDMVVGAECTIRPTYEEYTKERSERVERLTEFALRCLQNTLDKVKMEDKAHVLLEEVKSGGSKYLIENATIDNDEEMQWVKIE